MSTDKLARKSWDSFFRYYNFSKKADDTSKSEGVPVFPLGEAFSLKCCCRSYGNNLWIDEIKDIKCNSLEFDEVVGVKYVVEREVDENKAPRIVPVKKLNGDIGILNSKESATNQTITAEVDLPGFTFVKQPNIRIIKKVLNTKKGVTRFVQEGEANIVGTGKNPGFINSGQGVEFTNNYHDGSDKTIEMPIFSELKKASEVDLAYNKTLSDFYGSVSLLAQSFDVAGVGSAVYELPGESSFTRITTGIKRCCAITMIRMINGKMFYAIEADRTIYGYDKRWPVSTLLIRIAIDDHATIICNLVRILAESGHWEEVQLGNMKKNLFYERLIHRNDAAKYRWAERIRNVCVKLQGQGLE